MRYFYFDTAHAIKEHDFIIENTGGRQGMLNENLLDSVIEHVQNDIYYPAIEDKVAHILFSIVKNHPFNDGNKRSAIVLSVYFLELNGFDFKINPFIMHMENIVVHVAKNLINKELLLEIITNILYKEEFTEELQVKMLDAISTKQNTENDENEF